MAEQACVICVGTDGRRRIAGAWIKLANFLVKRGCGEGIRFAIVRLPLRSAHDAACSPRLQRGEWRGEVAVRLADFFAVRKKVVDEIHKTLHTLASLLLTNTTLCRSAVKATSRYGRMGSLTINSR